MPSWEVSCSFRRCRPSRFPCIPRYVSDRFLPDKAIDLVDEAAAKLQMEITSKPVALDEIDRKVMQLEMERVSLTKASRVRERRFMRASELRTERCGWGALGIRAV